MYRSILRIHATVLPPHLRQLGDSYVKEEWRKHMQADPVYVDGFLGAWRDYREALLDSPAGRDLRDEEIAALSKEQRSQLEALKRAAAEK